MRNKKKAKTAYADMFRIVPVKDFSKNMAMIQSATGIMKNARYRFLAGGAALAAKRDVDVPDVVVVALPNSGPPAPNAKPIELLLVLTVLVPFW
ncbi:hypothetical protein [Xylophilus sp.]|uniref:hypothetical protein n=1 Tax=Xylophilus sp. TaxID=2653893 RepID=UPI002D7E7073|nr:hypothetical protein [Xylophilus sp.]